MPAKSAYSETISIYSTQTAYDLERPYLVPMTGSCSIGAALGNQVPSLYPTLNPNFMYGYGCAFLYQISPGTGTLGVDQLVIKSDAAEIFAGQTLTISYQAYEQDPYV